uniref:Uncharacterized protein n=1 Tax=Arundo donax TaxID=35708 RepID=A0A0A9GXG9_ARUDO
MNVPHVQCLCKPRCSQDPRSLHVSCQSSKSQTTLPINRTTLLHNGSEQDDRPQQQRSNPQPTSCTYMTQLLSPKAKRKNREKHRSTDRR